MKHDCQDLIRLFAGCFAAQYNTRLVGGAAEPIYLPADAQESMHRIVFTRDYYRSALHEIAHWCVAGEARRQLVDFGYWYAPDGRSSAQQGAFEQVEVKPQALEWLFCEAAGHSFRVSLDNLSGEATDSTPFKLRVIEQVQHYLDNGIPQRAAAFVDALLEYYRPGAALDSQAFCIDHL
ncbi:elongation factor P hydroxylase [Pseudomonas sp. MYb185]|uniref:elongation factor P hydroxylase n=1 Tax=Pseudomonas sp. MYb185 TaxID=1848729 RepID=UPI000CFAF34F|nr:elongation factor P hydroxylase [Pseudomonas sp. MYb185]PRB81956.1 diaminobutyrate-2-oxoglutarate aminotransferase [Pseudomonas sp. MYb185]